MADGARLTTVEAVYEERSVLVTATNSFHMAEEIILVPCKKDPTTAEAAATSGDRGVTAWINRCTHEAQRFDTGRGVPLRNGEIICPKHGSLFDACSGDCDNGGDGPSSTSHIGF